MTQRKCGTCKYFEEGGIAASGWCRHPERQELQHMVLVRKTELACRDGWDHDLWEPKDGSGSGGNGSGPGLRGNDVPAGSIGASPASEVPSPRGSDSPGVATGLLEGNTRTAVRLRERDETTRRERSGSALETEWSPFDTPSLPFDRARDSEPVDEIRNETFSTRGVRIATRRRAPAPDAENPIADTTPEPEQGERNGARPAERDDLNPFNRPSPDSAGRFGAPRGEFPPNGREAARDVEQGSYQPEPVEQSGLTEPFEVMDDEDDRAEPAYIPESDSIPPQDDGENLMEPDVPDLDNDEGNDDNVSLNLPMSLQQEQCCRTCRDFRPAEGGRHGWCNNPFAFEGRQRVDADDLACRGTFGSWWSPADDWWIERADISHHSTPTPLIDELIRESGDDSDDRPRSTETRKSS
ncbi:MAG: hypothetical protein ACOC9Y_10110 [Chloroflexota bacterium]